MMKQEQKVYILGVEGRGAEVIKMLEDRGGKLYGQIDGEDRDLIYSISHNGDVFSALCDSEICQIIMDNYREIKLPEWKDGDVLTNFESNDCFAVYKSGCKSGDFTCHCYIYADCGEDSIDGEGGDIMRSDYRLASPSEVKRFYELLHKHGKEWDAEKKQLVDWKWKPRRGEECFCFDCGGVVLRFEWDGTCGDIECYNFGNCFRTREEAEAMAEKVKKLLKGD